MTNEQKEFFDNDYMPYIIKWGKFCTLFSIPLIFIPALVLIVVYGAVPSISGLVTGLLSLLSAMVVWYVVDPITLFPILHIPGMYLAYIAGNSKEIRAPAAAAALSASDVKAGTPEGTVIACLGVSTSIFVSITVMTIVAIAGNLIISVLPVGVVEALNYLLPALFGAMFVQRVMMDYKTAAIVVPIAAFLRFLNTKGLFAILPLGGGYAQILLCVIVGFLVARKVNEKKLSQK